MKITEEQLRKFIIQKCPDFNYRVFTEGSELLLPLLLEALDALEFYGREMNYSVDDYRGISGEMIKRCVLYSDIEERNDVYSYAGLRARKSLKSISEKIVQNE